MSRRHSYSTRSYRRRRAKGSDGVWFMLVVFCVLGEWAYHHPTVAIPLFSGIAILVIMFVEHVGQQRQSQIERTAKSGIAEIDKMTGAQFEERMAVHFQMMGFKVQKTPASNDYGADLVLTASNGRRIVVQCKRYAGNVGVNAVQEIIGAIPYYRAHSGMLVTNSQLTQNAKRLAQTANIVIWEREILIQKLYEAYEALNKRNASRENNTAGQKDSENEPKDQVKRGAAQTSGIPECFTILGFASTNVTDKEVRARYRDLVKQAHPDVGGNSASFVRLQEAYEQCMKALSL